MKIKGIVFDMDGVLLDTEKLYLRFWCEAAHFCGYPMEKSHVLSIRSMNREYAEKKLKGYFGEDFDYTAVHAKRVELMDKFIKENGVETKKGAKEILEFLKETGYKIALASATPRERAAFLLEKTRLLKYFDSLVSAHDVKIGKPEPYIYLEACKRLGLSPKECFAVEDSPNGVMSAYTAGCKTVMVPDLDKPNEATEKMTYAVVHDLLCIKDLLYAAQSAETEDV